MWFNKKWKTQVMFNSQITLLVTFLSIIIFAICNAFPSPRIELNKFDKIVFEKMGESDKSTQTI